MWKWMIGALGMAGAFGVAHAARSDDRARAEERERKRERNRRSLYAASLSGRQPPRRRAKQQDGPRRPALAHARASYWDALGLAAQGELSDDEQARREEERQIHTEALARIIASEAGPMSRTIKHAVAWLARNRSLLIKLPMLTMAAPGGRWGPIVAKRPMSSSQPATHETRRIAASVLAAPQSDDPTGGATHGFDVALQERLAEQGMRSYDAAAVSELWTTHYGLERIGQIETWVLYR